MKKLIAFFSLFLLVGAASLVQGQTIDAMANRAKAAANHCWQAYHVPHATVEAELAVIADCIGGAAGYGFNIMVYYNCPPQYAEICRPGPPTLAAYVFINCEGDVESVTCY